MVVNKLTVDGDTFYLDAEQSVEEAKSKIVEAVQHGGGLVDVLVAGHNTVSLLVSQNVRVMFETVEAEPGPSLHVDEFSDWDELGL